MKTFSIYLKRKMYIKYKPVTTYMQKKYTK